MIYREFLYRRARLNARNTIDDQEKQTIDWLETNETNDEATSEDNKTETGARMDV